MDGQYEAAPAASPGMIPTPRRSVETVGSAHGVIDFERGRVLSRYARLMRSGRPQVCRPSRREVAVPQPRSSAAGSDGKVIYPDRDAAECAARELEALGGRPQRPYLCERSRHGHYHLTTDQVAQRRLDERSRLLHTVIPQQHRRAAG